MIKSFKHRGLERFFLTGSKAGISTGSCGEAERVAHHAQPDVNPGMMNAAGWKLHALKGEFAGHWSVKVNGNWRLTFRFDGEDVKVVDYQDYH